MSASWYDVLGVAPDASSDEIRAAWKDSIADLDPTDRRFGLYNEAAGVLLDDEKRAAYDAELAPAETDEDAEAEGADDEAADEAGEDEAADEGADDAGAASAPRRLPVVPNWLLAVLLVATIAAAGTAFALHRGAEPGGDEIEDKVAAARTAAEQAVPKVLTYDYRYPERDHDRAVAVLDEDFREKYDQIWNDAILPNLTKAKATADSQVLGSGVVRASDEGDRVELVVVLSSTTTNRNVSTELPPLPMTVQMVEEDGEWLVADMDLWDPEQGEDESSSADPSGSPAPSGE